MTLSILHADNHLLVVDKPGGLPTQHSGAHPHNLEDLARQWVKETANKPGNVFLHAVHRLDRPVSGIVLFGRTSKAVRRLQDQQRQHAPTKRYLAWTARRPRTGLLCHWHQHGDRRAVISDQRKPGFKQVRLQICDVRRVAAGFACELELETGRYHQIRAQLAHIGCPILGDSVYAGPKYDRIDPRAIALHHTRLTIQHPTLKEPLTIRSTPPFLDERTDLSLG